MMSEILRKIELLWGIPVFYLEGGSDFFQSEDSGEKLSGDCEKETPVSFGNFLESGNPLMESAGLRSFLKERADNQQLPVIYKDGQDVYFVCVKSDSGYYFTGPMCIEGMKFAQFHHYCKAYHLEQNAERQPIQSTLIKMLNFASLLYEIVNQKAAPNDDILKENGITGMVDTFVERESTRMEMSHIDDEVYHHTYQEEHYAMQCIREGKGAEAVQRMEALNERMGILSDNQINHMRNTAIAVVTLATREAIKGGVAPAAAYRLSDLYINKIDRCTQAEEVVAYQRKIIFEFSEKVMECRMRKSASSYTDRCKDYIHKNYHHKIYLEDMAESIGVSKGYLSRRFREDEEISIQEYIQKFRVERAENLLKYSEASLLEISDYVHFHSQSHFGSVFKKYTGMTPRQYREKNKQKEFTISSV